MDLLNYRQYLIEQLLTLYRLRENANASARITIESSIDALLIDLKRIDKSFVKFGEEYTLYHRQDSESEESSDSAFDQLPEHFKRIYTGAKTQPFNDAQISRFIGDLGFEDAKANDNLFDEKVLKAENALTNAYAKVEPFIKASYLLDPLNPFSYVNGHMLQYKVRYHSQDSLVQFVQDAEAQLADKLANARSRLNLGCPIPLFEHDDILDEWLALETKNINKARATETQTQLLKDVINQRFYQAQWLEYWALMKKNAALLDSAESIQARLEKERNIHRSLSLSPVSHFARSYPKIKSTHPLQIPHTAVRPQFIDEQGQPYANTQILCWRYNPKEPKYLGRMDLDRELFGLYTIGIVYTDANGYPTLQKPDFLQAKTHDLSLQIEEDTGNVLLLERTTAQRTEQPNPQDPLTRCWHSYDGEDNLINMSDAIAAVSDNTTLSAENWTSATLDDIGLNKPGRLSHDLTANDISGLFEFPVDYEFGFMVMPLGYGSMSIQALHTLPDTQDDKSQVCVRQSITKNLTKIALPKTLRQSTHELVQARDQLASTQQKLLEVNLTKFTDIQEIDRLKGWVKDTISHPFEKEDASRIIEKQKLHAQLGKLQQGIRNTVYHPPFAERFKDSRDATEAETYNRQFANKQAAENYHRALNQAFALLENQATIKRLDRWRKHQDAIDEVEQVALACWVDEVSEGIYENKRVLTRTPTYTYTRINRVNAAITAPYTSYFYSAMGDLLAQMAVSHESNRLFEDYLLPVLEHWLEDKNLTAIIEEAFKQTSGLENKTFLSHALQMGLKNTASENSSLIDLIGTTEDAFKTIFIRGPGAPALMQAILDLSGHMIQTRYQVDIHIQTQLSIRMYALYSMFTLKVSGKNTYNRMGKFVYRVFAGNNPTQMKRILSAKNMSDWAYGDDAAFSNASSRSRFEAYVKTGLFLWDQVFSKLLFMNHMDEDKWDPTANLTADDYRTAAYRYATTTMNTANGAVTLLTVPAMMKFWVKRFGKDSSKIGRLLEKEIGRNAANIGSKLFGAKHGDSIGRWVVGAGKATDTAEDVLKGATKAFGVAESAMVWANRLCIITTAISLVQSIDDTRRAIRYGEETDMLVNSLMTVSAAATLTGTVLLAIGVVPIVGTALCVAGLVIAIGVKVIATLWQAVGESFFMGDTYVQFNKHWSAFKSDIHYLEYKDASFDAPANLVNLCKEINDQYERSLADQFDGIGHAYKIGKEYHPLAGLMAFVLTRLGAIKTDDDVSWQEMSFTAIPSLLVHHNVSHDIVRNCIELNWDEREQIFNMMDQPRPATWDDKATEDAKFWWTHWFINMQHFAKDNPEHPFITTVWQTFLDGGAFPADTSPYELSHQIELPIVAFEHLMFDDKEKRRNQFQTFMALWKKRSELIHGQTGT